MAETNPTETVPAETVANALQDLETRRRELSAILRNVAARAVADADTLDAVDLEKWIMANATQLVTDLLTKARADKDQIAADKDQINTLQKHVDDLTAKGAELEPRSVDQTILNDVGTFLNPPVADAPPQPAPL